MLTDEQKGASEFGCQYVPAYSSGCKAISVDEHRRCKAHTGKVCVSCGGPAMHECNHTGQFVCGAPLCRDCEGWNDTSKASGTWGFMNHSHRVKPSIVAARIASGGREAVAADFGMKDTQP